MKQDRQGKTMATESIQALKPIGFSPSRTRARDEEKPHTAFEFAHWLADDAGANEDFFGSVRFPVPLMSAEGILILAQAQEEEFSLAAPVPERAYTHAAEISPVEDGQMSFDFITAHPHAGDVVDEDV
jgi:hypothetical protein